jgi:hypothetical protein
MNVDQEITQLGLSCNRVDGPVKKRDKLAVSEARDPVVEEFLSSDDPVGELLSEGRMKELAMEQDNYQQENLWVEVDGRMSDVDDININTYLPMVSTDGKEYYLANSSGDAGEIAREYWQNMIDNNPEEFSSIIGVDVMAKWARGISAGPGNVRVRSLSDWLDLVSDHPEEEFSVDSKELEAVLSEDLAKMLNLKPTVVAYRHS